MSGSDFTLTPNYGFKKPVVGSDFDLWGGHVNEDLDSIDSLIFSLNGGLVAPTASPAYGRNGSTWLPVLPLAGGVMGGAVALAGVSTAPLAAPGTNTAQIATTAFVAAGLALYLPLVGGNLSGPLGLPSGGTATVPSLQIGGTNNGIYSGAGTTLQFSANGALRFTIGGTMITPTVPIRGAAGSAAAPAYSFSADSATGFYQPSVNTIALSVGGNDVATATAGKAVSFLGAVTLAQDATLAFQAVTLRQMQAATTGAYLPLVGGSITGTPGALAVGSTLPADAAVGDLLAGIASPTGIAFNAYSAPGPAWKTRIAGFSAMETFDQASGTIAWWTAPSVAAGATASPVNYMALNSTGLSVYGTTYSQGRIFANGGVSFGPNNSWEFVTYIDASGNHITNHRSNWYDAWLTSGGLRQWCSPNGSMMSLDGSGNLGTAGNVNAGGLVISTGADGNGYGASFQGGVWTHGNIWSDGVIQCANWFRTANYIMNASGVFYVADNTAYYLARNSSDGNWRFVENNTVNFTVQTDGNCVARGAFTSGYLHSTGNTQTDGDTYTNGNFYSGPGGLNARWYATSGSNYYVQYVNGNPNWGDCQHHIWHIPSSTVYHHFTIGGGMSYDFHLGGSVNRQDGWFLSWNPPSDIRIKRNIKPSMVDALDIICRIPIEEFDILPEAATFMQPARYSGERAIITEPQHVPLGMVAQHVGAVLEAMETITPHHVEGSPLPVDLHSVDRLAAVPYLIRAMQQINARIVALEGHA